MIISVASGKGGTGKTTVAVGLARALAEDVELLDCDVEEPNAHLFLQPEIQRKRSVTTFVPKISEALCSHCNKCVDICRFHALARVGKKILVFPELCHSCGGCQIVCEDDAVIDSRRELGVEEYGRSGPLHFGQGRLRVGEPMAPPLIRAVKAGSAGCKTIIIDAPPGTSCPVVSAVRGSDYVIMVTEPTPFGLHDLTLGVGMVRTLGLPFGLVINRADSGDSRVADYARQEGVEVLLEIPYDRKIAEAYSEGQSIVDARPEYLSHLRQMAKRISRQVGPRRSHA